MADISAIKPVERIVEIVHPGTDENIGLRFTLLSLTDPRMSEIRRRIQDRNIQKQARGKELTALDIENNVTKLAFSACTGWEWHKDAAGDKTTFNGEQPDWNEANFKRVVAELGWIEAQLTKEISDEKAFFTASSGS
jgi:hypothetical protein